MVFILQDTAFRATGVPASVTLAQAALETGWGAATIGDAKNLLGIEGTGPAIADRRLDQPLS